jgi:acetyl esterase/lipase
VSSVELVESWQAAPITQVRVAVGRVANVDIDALSQFALGWEASLGVTIEVGGAEDLAGLDPSEPLVVDAETAALLGRRTTGRTVAVDFDGATADLDRVLEGAARIGGRGIGGYRWAIRHLVSRGAWAATTYRYGGEAEQFADLRLPAGGGPHPLVVLIHGGGWKHRWQRDLMAPIAVDLAQRGFASWNVEFRRVGGGGGWPTTFDDLRAAIDAVAAVDEAGLLDLQRVCFLGHSSGGHLALWAAADGQTRVRPALVVAIAAVTDLVEAWRRQLVGGENIVLGLLGGTPTEVPERYAAASPAAMLPLGMPQLLVQGLRDYIPDLVDLNRSYARAARAAGDDVELVELPDVEHLEPVESSSAAWNLTGDKLEHALGSSRKLARTRTEAN